MCLNSSVSPLSIRVENMTSVYRIAFIWWETHDSFKIQPCVVVLTNCSLMRKTKLKSPTLNSTSLSLLFPHKAA